MTENQEPVRAKPRRTGLIVALALALTTLAGFWAAASAADFFLDAPFIYTTNTEWDQALLLSNARFFTLPEASLHLIAGAFLLPAVGALCWALTAAGIDPFRWFERVAQRRWVGLVIALVAALGALFAARVVIAGAHILDDEHSYQFQAQLFARGKIGLPSPPEAMRNPMILLRPMWTSKYPPGHALALVPGVLVGWPRLVPILDAALLALAVITFARTAFGPRHSLLAGVLIACSPFVWAVCGSMMAFSTFATAFAWALAAMALARASGKSRYWLLAGAALGWGFITRPYDAVALAVAPVLATLAAQRLRAWRSLGLVALGFFPVAALFAVHNYLVMGDPLKLPYTAAGLAFNVGFRQAIPPFPYVHTPVQAAGHLAVALLRLDLWLFAAPGSLLLVLVGLLQPNKTYWDWTLLGTLLCFLAAYMLVPSSGTWDVGPTYYFAVVPVLVPLAVRGLSFLREQLSRFEPRLGALAGALALSLLFVSWSSVAPLRMFRLSKLCTDIRAPWRTIAASKIGNAIVIAPPARQRHAAGYYHGYPYEVRTGPDTVALLTQPLDAAELEEARRFLGPTLPVYEVVYSPGLSRKEGRAAYEMKRVR